MINVKRNRWFRNAESRTALPNPFAADPTLIPNALQRPVFGRALFPQPPCIKVLSVSHFAPQYPIAPPTGTHNISMVSSSQNGSIHPPHGASTTTSAFTRWMWAKRENHLECRRTHTPCAALYTQSGPESRA